MTAILLTSVLLLIETADDFPGGRGGQTVTRRTCRGGRFTSSPRHRQSTPWFKVERWTGGTAVRLRESGNPLEANLGVQPLSAHGERGPDRFSQSLALEWPERLSHAQ